MAQPRRTQIDLQSTPYYHCVSRCVRKAFLCGNDSTSKHNFSHRREWIQQRLFFLTQSFMIKIAAFAVMSNHYHVVLFVDVKGTKKLTDKDIIRRWHKIFKGTMLSHKLVQGKKLSEAEKVTLKKTIEIWRNRLMDISWFMRCTNEWIARKANKEDNCTGHFWEGRFKSQALLDDKALLACMTYVDLNPIRANISKSLNSSKHTSIQIRLRTNQNISKSKSQSKVLMPLIQGNKKADHQLNFHLKDYLELVQWTSTMIQGSRGEPDKIKSPIVLDKKNISITNWLRMTTRFESIFKTFVGNVYYLKAACNRLNFKRRPNVTVCKQMFGN